VSQAALFSPQRVCDEDDFYRYSLSSGRGRKLLWCMLNPSTANATESDPTMTRVAGFTKAFGFDSWTIVNAYAYRTPEPAYLHDAQKRGVDVFGPRNVETLLLEARGHDDCVIAWGAGLKDQAHAARVIGLLEQGPVRLWTLGRTKEGHPKHPLYLKASTKLEAFRP
jgi:hypothetical protein